MNRDERLPKLGLTTDSRKIESRRGMNRGSQEWKKYRSELRRCAVVTRSMEMVLSLELTLGAAALSAILISCLI
jgi:hypothetical protein